MRVLARLIGPLIGCVLLLAAYAGPVAAGTVISPNGTPLPACGQYLDDLTPQASYDDWQTTLLDTILAVPKSYVPPDLVSISSAGISGYGKIRSLAIDDLREMTSAAAAAGAPIAAMDAYRSYSSQVSLFNSYVKADGYDRALRYSARPGHSEHQLGTTIDFKSKGGPDPWDLNDWAIDAGRQVDGQQRLAIRLGARAIQSAANRRRATCMSRGTTATSAAPRPRICTPRATTREYLWQLGSGDQTGTSAPAVTICGPIVGTKRLTTTKVPLTVSWSSSDPSKVAAFTLEQKVDDSSWTSVPAGQPNGNIRDPVACPRQDVPIPRQGQRRTRRRERLVDERRAELEHGRGGRCRG